MKKTKSKHSPSIQASLDGAKKEYEAKKEKIDAHNAHIEIAQDSYLAWTKLANFPNSIAEAEYRRAYVENILELAQTLEAGGLQGRIDELEPGPAGKQVAIEIFRCAFAGDVYTLTDLLRQSVDGGEFAYDIDHWLRFELMKEVLQIKESSRPVPSDEVASLIEELCAMSGATPVGEEEPVRGQKGTATPPAPKVTLIDKLGSPPTDLQTAILKALNGQKMKKAKLAEACHVDEVRLYYINRKKKTGGLTELQAKEIVKHKDGIGYYRPDAPPSAT